MGPGYFVIAIFGCADGAADCTRVATVPTRYESVSACSAASGDALLQRTDLDFPTLMAECRGVTSPAAASDSPPIEAPADTLQG